MGAWGWSTLSDDTALDVLDEWMSSSTPLEVMKGVLEEALESDSLDYTQAHEMSVLAMVVDHCLNGISIVDQPETQDIEGYAAWLKKLNLKQIQRMKIDVAQCVDLIIDENCELAQLWAESASVYEQWHQNQMDRRDRLLPHYDVEAE